MNTDDRETGIAALAKALHDEYGCRISCRGGRLADDGHPSHAEAYRDQAVRITHRVRDAIPAEPLDRVAVLDWLWAHGDDQRIADAYQLVAAALPDTILPETDQ